MKISSIYNGDTDIGYKEKYHWWGSSDPDGYRLANLNVDYPEQYFATDHVSPEVVKNYCDCVISEYESFTGNRLKSIIEFGSGAGWFSKEFYDRGMNISGYEGSETGVRRCIDRGFINITQRDFRKHIPTNDKYQIALCTEVAGHIEPPFSSMLVHNLINHSNVIWWSSEVPGQNRPHLHHPNEQLYEYWINIFEFYGYGAKLLSDDVFDKCEKRGRYLFYNKKIILNEST